MKRFTKYPSNYVKASRDTDYGITEIVIDILLEGNSTIDDTQVFDCIKITVESAGCTYNGGGDIENITNDYREGYIVTEGFDPIDFEYGDYEVIRYIDMADRIVQGRDTICENIKSGLESLGYIPIFIELFDT